MPHLVLLNGSVFNQKQWDPILRWALEPMLGKQYDFLRYEYRGIATPNYIEHSWNIFDLARDLAVLLDRHNIRKAHLYGVSKGTIVGLAFSILYPERVLSLGGYGWYYIGYSGLDQPKRYFEKRLSAFEKLENIWKRPLGPIEFEMLWREVYCRIAMGKNHEELSLCDRFKEILVKRTVYRLCKPTPIKAMYDWFSYGVKELPKERDKFISGLERLNSTPVLIQHALKDETLPIGMAQELAKALPTSKLIEYGSGFNHLSIGTSKQRCRAIISDYAMFLENLTRDISLHQAVEQTLSP